MAYFLNFLKISINVCRIAFDWTKAKQILDLCVNGNDSGVKLKRQQMIKCCFVLGKMAEKKNPRGIIDALKYYRMAEKQLFDQMDANLLTMKIEISFRITASIYKYIERMENVIDADNGEALLHTLKRDKSRLFNEMELATRAKHVEHIDENANKMFDGDHKSSVSTSPSKQNSSNDNDNKRTITFVHSNKSTKYENCVPMILNGIMNCVRLIIKPNTIW